MKNAISEFAICYRWFCSRFVWAVFGCYAMVAVRPQLFLSHKIFANCKFTYAFVYLQKTLILLL